MQRLKEIGKFTGGFPPFGYYVDEEGSLTMHDAEARLIAAARHHRAEGLTLKATAEMLGDNPRTGKPFTIMQIQRML